MSELFFIHLLLFLSFVNIFLFRGHVGIVIQTLYIILQV